MLCPIFQHASVLEVLVEYGSDNFHRPGFKKSCIQLSRDQHPGLTYLVYIEDSFVYNIEIYHLVWRSYMYIHACIVLVRIPLNNDNENRSFTVYIIVILDSTSNDN